MGSSKKKSDEDDEENDENEDADEEFELLAETIKSSKINVSSPEKMSRVRRQSIKKPAKYRVGYESGEEEPKQKYGKRNRWQNKESIKIRKARIPSKSSQKIVKQSSIYELKEEDLEDEPRTKAVKSKVLKKVSKKQANKTITSRKCGTKAKQKGGAKLFTSVPKNKKEAEDLPKSKIQKGTSSGRYLC